MHCINKREITVIDNDELKIDIDEPYELHEEIQEAQRKIAYIRENNPKVDMVVNPRCQAVLEGNGSASKKLETMIDVFLSEYPTYILPEDEELRHPAYLARYFDIPMWLVQQCGDVVKFYRLYLDAAKEWFLKRTDSKLEGAFSYKFESLGLVSHLGEDEAMQPIWKDYFEWWHGRRPKG